MGFQTTILDRQAYGNVGEFFDDSPRRVETAILESADPADNVFGRVFTRIGQTTDCPAQIVEAGGTGVFVGFLIGPKEHASYGTVGDALAPSLTLPNYVNAALCNMGVIYVKLPAVANVGDLVLYAEADGALSTILPGAALPVGQQFAHAVVDQFQVADVDPNDSEYLAVIRITDVATAPAP